MHIRATASTIALAAVTLLAGCGGSSGSGGGGLSFRALWQQNGSVAAVAPALPASVKTIEILFESDAGFKCCTAIDPAQLPIDASGGANLTLSDLPGGTAKLTVFGFPTDFAPAPSGASRMCPAVPSNAARACSTTQTAAPSYESNPTRVNIVPGQDNDAGDITIFPVPIGPGGPCTSIGAPAPTPGTGGTPITVIVHAGGNIAAAARNVPAGSTVIVSPGVYAPISFAPGDLQGPITLVADETGRLTQSVAAPITINAHGAAAGIDINGQNGIILDGFHVEGSSGTGILVQSSSSIVIRNCVVTGSGGDGIHVTHTDQTLVFDNLSYANLSSGIELQCTSSVQVINNTLYGNRSSGVLISQSQPSLTENNITDANTPVGTTVNADSTSGYQTDFNLNTDGYAPGTPVGTRDINASNSPGILLNPLFIAPTLGDFHLQVSLTGSGSPAVDAAAPTTDPDLVSQLGKRSTQSDGALDVPPPDLGYHYASVVAAATPAPTATATPRK